MRVCQFRHFGDSTSRRSGIARQDKTEINIFTGVLPVVKPRHADQRVTPKWQFSSVTLGFLPATKPSRSHGMRRLGPVLFATASKSFDCPVLEAYSCSFAFMVILALSTFETGHPVLAFSAAFWKVAGSALGTRPTTSR
jgi:hypothetical protein